MTKNDQKENLAGEQVKKCRPVYALFVQSRDAPSTWSDHSND